MHVDYSLEDGSSQKIRLYLTVDNSGRTTFAIVARLSPDVTRDEIVQIARAVSCGRDPKFQRHGDQWAEERTLFFELQSEPLYDSEHAWLHEELIDCLDKRKSRR